MHRYSCTAWADMEGDVAMHTMGLHASRACACWQPSSSWRALEPLPMPTLLTIPPRCGRRSTVNGSCHWGAASGTYHARGPATGNTRRCFSKSKKPYTGKGAADKQHGTLHTIVHDWVSPHAGQESPWGNFLNAREASTHHALAQKPMHRHGIAPAFTCGL